MTLACAADRRLEKLRAAGLNGIAAVEVSDDHLHLCVTFLAGVPEGVTKENLRVDGGRRVRHVGIVSIRRRPPDEHHDDECLELTLDRAGDPSGYRVCVVDVDERGRPTGRPYPGFDQRYLCAEFSFTTDCDGALDCAPVDDCVPDVPNPPLLDLLVRDYPGFRRLLLDRMSLLVPTWRERHVPDLGITLVELLAYVADQLAYAQDAVATEAYLGTARHRISVRRHARLVDYVLSEGCNARAFVSVEVEGAASYEAPAGSLLFVTRHAGSPQPGAVLDAGALPDAPHECFMPVTDDPAASLTFDRARNRIELWTWGDEECCLPVGSTSAWLAGAEGLAVAAGDLLLFEEVTGPRTGRPEDADPSHRHVVRLTAVTELVDELYEQPVLEVTWDDDDALPFPLCVSAISAAPACEPLTSVSVARGNIVLVDHGCPAPADDLDPVPDPPVDDCCAGPCQPGDVERPPARYRPRPLQRWPVTFATPAPTGSEPASTLLEPDPRLAVPALRLDAHRPDPLGGDGESERERWVARAELLRSGPDDRHVVAEIDDDGRAHLRFGDDVLGEAPEPGTRFTAHYRVGNGSRGNVSAEAIAHIARAGTAEHGVSLFVRNPLPGRGGTDPEPLAIAKMLAPTAHRARRERAVVAEDYAELARRDVRAVQAAGATPRWTGSWYEILVAVDQLGRPEPAPDVLDGVAARLERYRRMGHDVAVAGVETVPLVIRLSVCVAPRHARATVHRELLAAFSNRTLTGGRRGLFHPDELLPGAPVVASVLVAAAQAIEGVESVEIVELRRLFGDADGPLVPPGGVLRLAPLEVARVDNDPHRVDTGTITFELRGGR